LCCREHRRGEQTENSTVLIPNPPSSKPFGKPFGGTEMYFARFGELARLLNALSRTVHQGDFIAPANMPIKY
jgi:hypothetical protein